MTTTESNKLIAEFMELKEGKKYLSPSLEEPEAIGLGMYVSVDEMRYHASWDWLMPVVEKIDTLFGEDDTVDDMINRVHNAVLHFSPLNKGIVYNAVVEFIKYYNLNK